ncbi:hypothetical protein TDB9533_03822 [Thalassocella blandensis]|nr:hypothetical protein TDB9533_03822 [Thalassocella blandensis]
MAILKEDGKNHFCYLMPHHSFGRRVDVVDTPLHHEEVSKIHAVIEWTGNCWLLKDMSRNGVWLNGQKIPSLTPVVLQEGATIAFNKDASLFWKVINLDAPSNLLLTLPPSHKFIPVQDYLLLPDNDSPQWVLYRNKDLGEWVCRPIDENLVDDAGGVVLKHGEMMKIGDRFWQAFFPPELALTKDRNRQQGLADVSFHFDVSLDEEVIGLQVKSKDGEIDLGQRVYFYLLLYLARKKQEDARQAYAEKEQGWVRNEILTRELGLDDSHLNIQIYRIRQQCSAALSAVADIDGFLQRRRGSLRLGVSAASMFIHKHN